MGEDDLEDGDEEAEDWDWEEVDVLLPREWTTGAEVNLADEEDEICGGVEDEVGENVFDGRVAAGAVGDEEKREQCEEEAEDWDRD